MVSKQLNRHAIDHRGDKRIHLGQYDAMACLLAKSVRTVRVGQENNAATARQNLLHIAGGLFKERT